MNSKLILLLAIIMGAITTFLFSNYMKNAALSQEVITNEVTVDIIVAAEPMKKNERITADKLAIQTIPETAFFQQSITSKEELEGLFVTADMEMGEAFLSHRVQSEKEENLFISRKIKEGYRAVSVAVNYVESVSTLVEPEDIVDVIFSEMNEIAEKDDKNKRETVVSRVLLENIRVVAVGRRMNELTSPENHVEYSTVTFELKSEDAVRLINATERGKIHLMLKSRINE